MSNRASSAELRSIIERIERLDAEISDGQEAKKEVYAEAKGQGYDTKVLRKVVARRKRDRDDLAEEQAVLDMYETALEGGE